MRRATFAMGMAAAIALGGCDAGAGRPAAVQARGETFNVANATPVAGTRFVSIGVALETTGGGSYSSSSTSNLRNMVLLDTASGASRRLLPDNARRIRAVHWLSPDDRDGTSRTVPGTAEAPARWYALEVERPGGATVDLIAGAIEGGAPAVVARGIDGIDLLAMRDPIHVTLIARQGGRLSYRLLDMAALRQVGRTGIAI